MDKLIYQPEDGDEIIFLPNIFTDKKSAIGSISDAIEIEISQLYVNSRVNGRGKYFYGHPHFNHDLYLAIKSYCYANRGTLNTNNIFVGMKYYSTILFNDEIRIFTYGRKIHDIIKNEMRSGFNQNYIIGYKPKKLLIRIKMTQGFKNFDNTRFSDYTTTSKFQTPQEYNDELNRIDFKSRVENHMNHNFIHKNIGELYKYLKDLEIKDVYNKPEFKKLFTKYDRADKLKEILLNDDN